MTEQSKPKWTPGPWWIGPTPHYLAMGQVHRGVYPITIRSNEHTEEIATVWTCLLPTEANAHLIAAAPELYEELRKLRQECVDVMLGTRPSITASMLHDSEIALAKARGETE